MNILALFFCRAKVDRTNEIENVFITDEHFFLFLYF